MPDHSIYHDFPIEAPPERVFAVLQSPEGLDAWWTLESAGTPARGGTYRLGFGPEYDWAAVLKRFEPPRLVEWEMTRADRDWLGTRVGFELDAIPGGTQVRFWHAGWREVNDHFRRSSYCWAMYLRLLRRYIESGQTVPYAGRLAT